MHRADGPAPKARQDQLVVKELADETLVYDENNHKAHCLNRTAAFVWQHCDGRTSVEKMAQLLEKEMKTTVSEQMILFALDQLEKSRLLEKPATRPALMAQMSRRELVRRLGIGAAVALPLVTSIVAPSATSAQTVRCGGDGAPCTVRADCCSPLFCCGGFGGGTCCAG